MIWLLLIFGIMGLVSGCDGGIMEGVAIGIGTSEAATEAQALAEAKKTALVAEILRLREALANAPTVAEKELLQEALDTAEKKQEIAALTESITASVNEGIRRDWSEPAAPDNLAWILGSAATILGGYAGKKKYDDSKKAKAIAAVKIAAKSEAEAKVYNALNVGA
jgi:hypothetical protein